MRTNKRKSFFEGFCSRFKNKAIIVIRTAEMASLKITTVIGSYPKYAILNQINEKLQKKAAANAEPNAKKSLFFMKKLLQAAKVNFYPN